jgi:hypothetical protein
MIIENPEKINNDENDKDKVIDKDKNKNKENYISLISDMKKYHENNQKVNRRKSSHTEISNDIDEWNDIKVN